MNPETQTQSIEPSFLETQNTNFEITSKDIIQALSSEESVSALANILSGRSIGFVATHISDKDTDKSWENPADWTDTTKVRWNSSVSEGVVAISKDFWRNKETLVKAGWNRYASSALQWTNRFITDRTGLKNLSKQVLGTNLNGLGLASSKQMTDINKKLLSNKHIGIDTIVNRPGILDSKLDSLIANLCREVVYTGNDNSIMNKLQNLVVTGERAEKLVGMCQLAGNVITSQQMMNDIQKFLKSGEKVITSKYPNLLKVKNTLRTNCEVAKGKFLEMEMVAKTKPKLEEMNQTLQKTQREGKSNEGIGILATGDMRGSYDVTTTEGLTKIAQMAVSRSLGFWRNIPVIYNLSAAGGIREDQLASPEALFQWAIQRGHTPERAAELVHVGTKTAIKKWKDSVGLFGKTSGEAALARIFLSSERVATGSAMIADAGTYGRYLRNLAKNEIQLKQSQKPMDNIDAEFAAIQRISSEFNIDGGSELINKDKLLLELENFKRESSILGNVKKGQFLGEIGAIAMGSFNLIAQGRLMEFGSQAGFSALREAGSGLLVADKELNNSNFQKFASDSVNFGQQQLAGFTGDLAANASILDNPNVSNIIVGGQNVKYEMKHGALIIHYLNGASLEQSVGKILQSFYQDPTTFDKNGQSVILRTTIRYNGRNISINGGQNLETTMKYLNPTLLAIPVQSTSQATRLINNEKSGDKFAKMETENYQSQLNYLKSTFAEIKKGIHIIAKNNPQKAEELRIAFSRFLDAENTTLDLQGLQLVQAELLRFAKNNGIKIEKPVFESESALPKKPAELKILPDPDNSNKFFGIDLPPQLTKPVQKLKDLQERSGQILSDNLLGKPAMAGEMPTVFGSTKEIDDLVDSFGLPQVASELKATLIKLDNQMDNAKTADEVTKALQDFETQKNSLNKLLDQNKLFLQNYDQIKTRINEIDTKFQNIAKDKISFAQRLENSKKTQEAKLPENPNINLPYSEVPRGTIITEGKNNFFKIDAQGNRIKVETLVAGSRVAMKSRNGQIFYSIFGGIDSNKNPIWKQENPSPVLPNKPVTKLDQNISLSNKIVIPAQTQAILQQNFKDLNGAIINYNQAIESKDATQIQTAKNNLERQLQLSSQFVQNNASQFTQTKTQFDQIVSKVRQDLGNSNQVEIDPREPAKTQTEQKPGQLKIDITEPAKTQILSNLPQNTVINLDFFKEKIAKVNSIPDLQAKLDEFGNQKKDVVVKLDQQVKDKLITQKQAEDTKKELDNRYEQAQKIAEARMTELDKPQPQTVKAEIPVQTSTELKIPTTFPEFWAKDNVVFARNGKYYDKQGNTLAQLPNKSYIIDTKGEVNYFENGQSTKLVQKYDPAKIKTFLEQVNTPKPENPVAKAETLQSSSSVYKYPQGGGGNIAKISDNLFTATHVLTGTDERFSIPSDWLDLGGDLAIKVGSNLEKLRSSLPDNLYTITKKMFEGGTKPENMKPLGATIITHRNGVEENSPVNIQGLIFPINTPERNGLTLISREPIVAGMSGSLVKFGDNNFGIVSAIQTGKIQNEATTANVVIKKTAQHFGVSIAEAKTMVENNTVTIIPITVDKLDKLLKANPETPTQTPLQKATQLAEDLRKQGAKRLAELQARTQNGITQAKAGILRIGNGMENPTALPTSFTEFLAKNILVFQIDGKNYDEKGQVLKELPNKSYIVSRNGEVSYFENNQSKKLTQTYNPADVKAALESARGGEVKPVEGVVKAVDINLIGMPQETSIIVNLSGSGYLFNKTGQEITNAENPVRQNISAPPGYDGVYVIKYKNGNDFIYRLVAKNQNGRFVEIKEFTDQKNVTFGLNGKNVNPQELINGLSENKLRSELKAELVSKNPANYIDEKLQIPEKISLEEAQTRYQNAIAVLSNQNFEANTAKKGEIVKFSLIDTLNKLADTKNTHIRSTHDTSIVKSLIIQIYIQRQELRPLINELLIASYSAKLNRGVNNQISNNLQKELSELASHYVKTENGTKYLAIDYMAQQEGMAEFGLSSDLATGVRASIFKFSESFMLSDRNTLYDLSVGGSTILKWRQWAKGEGAARNMPQTQEQGKILLGLLGLKVNGANLEAFRVADPTLRDMIQQVTGVYEGMQINRHKGAFSQLSQQAHRAASSIEKEIREDIEIANQANVLINKPERQSYLDENRQVSVGSGETISNYEHKVKIGLDLSFGNVKEVAMAVISGQTIKFFLPIKITETEKGSYKNPELTEQDSKIIKDGIKQAIKEIPIEKYGLQQPKNPIAKIALNLVISKLTSGLPLAGMVSGSRQEGIIQYTVDARQLQDKVDTTTKLLEGFGEMSPDTAEKVIRAINEDNTNLAVEIITKEQNLSPDQVKQLTAIITLSNKYGGGARAVDGLNIGGNLENGQSVAINNGFNTYKVQGLDKINIPSFVSGNRSLFEEQTQGLVNMGMSSATAKSAFDYLWDTTNNRTRQINTTEIQNLNAKYGENGKFIFTQKSYANTNNVVIKTNEGDKILAYTYIDKKGEPRGYQMLLYPINAQVLEVKNTQTGKIQLYRIGGDGLVPCLNNDQVIEIVGNQKPGFSFECNTSGVCVPSIKDLPNPSVEVGAANVIGRLGGSAVDKAGSIAFGVMLRSDGYRQLDFRAAAKILEKNGKDYWAIATADEWFEAFRQTGYKEENLNGIIGKNSQGKDVTLKEFFRNVVQDKRQLAADMQSPIIQKSVIDINSVTTTKINASWFQKIKTARWTTERKENAGQNSRLVESKTEVTKVGSQEVARERVFTGSDGKPQFIVTNSTVSNNVLTVAPGGSITLPVGTNLTSSNGLTITSNDSSGITLQNPLNHDLAIGQYNTQNNSGFIPYEDIVSNLVSYNVLQSSLFEDSNFTKIITQNGKTTFITDKMKISINVQTDTKIIVATLEEGGYRGRYQVNENGELVFNDNECAKVAFKKATIGLFNLSENASGSLSGTSNSQNTKVNETSRIEEQKTLRQKIEQNNVQRIEQAKQQGQQPFNNQRNDANIQSNPTAAPGPTTNTPIPGQPVEPVPVDRTQTPPSTTTPPSPTEPKAPVGGDKPEDKPELPNEPVPDKVPEPIKGNLNTPKVKPEDEPQEPAIQKDPAAPPPVPEKQEPEKVEPAPKPITEPAPPASRPAPISPTPLPPEKKVDAPSIAPLPANTPPPAPVTPPAAAPVTPKAPETTTNQAPIPTTIVDPKAPAIEGSPAGQPAGGVSPVTPETNTGTSSNGTAAPQIADPNSVAAPAQITPTVGGQSTTTNSEVSTQAPIKETAVQADPPPSINFGGPTSQDD